MIPQTTGIHHVTAICGEPQRNVDFYAWAHAPGGRIGTGQLVVTSFSIPAASLGYWTERLVERGVRFERPRERFGDTVLSFGDPDRLRLELVAAADARVGRSGGPVREEDSVRGFHHVTLAVEDRDRTVRLM